MLGISIAFMHAAFAHDMRAEGILLIKICAFM